MAASERITQPLRSRNTWRPWQLGGILGLTLSVCFTATDASAEAKVTAAPQKIVPLASLPQRSATFIWDKGLLRSSFSYREVIDRRVATKLASGLPNVIAMRAYVLRDRETNPVALTVKTCRVVYDLWDEVYRIRITEPGRDRNAVAINLEGVLRQCAEAKDLPVVNRSLLRAKSPHFLGIIVEVNPISPQVVEQMKRWMSRPTGATTIGPSDSLFGSVVSLFMRKFGTSDANMQFRTPVVIP